MGWCISYLHDIVIHTRKTFVCIVKMSDTRTETITELLHICFMGLDMFAQLTNTLLDIVSLLFDLQCFEALHDSLQVRQQRRWTNDDHLAIDEGILDEITSVGAGDRDGFKTRQIQGMLTSGSQTTSTVSRDNELVIIYQIS